MALVKGQIPTDLVINGIDIPPFSVRGASQTLNTIDGAGFMLRTVNARLDDLSNPLFRKFVSEISCSDQMPPAFDGLHRGKSVIVDCIYELAYKTAGGAPARPVVPDSSHDEDDGFTYYRPRLTMRVVNFTQSKEEYPHMTTWSLTLEEI